MRIEPFDLRPRCPKCLHDRWGRHLVAPGLYAEPGKDSQPIPEHLTMTCEACGYWFWMQPADVAGYDAARQ